MRRRRRRLETAAFAVEDLFRNLNPSAENGGNWVFDDENGYW